MHIIQRALFLLVVVQCIIAMNINCEVIMS